MITYYNTTHKIQIIIYFVILFLVFLITLLYNNKLHDNELITSGFNNFVSKSEQTEQNNDNQLLWILKEQNQLLRERNRILQEQNRILERIEKNLSRK